MIQLRNGLVAFLIMAIGLSATPTFAGIVFFDNQQIAYQGAVSNEMFLGTETFDKSTVGSGGIDGFDGPLDENSNQIPFGNGLDQTFATYSTVNSGPGGNDLIAVNNWSLVDVEVVMSNASADALIVAFDQGLNVTAVDFNPIVNDLASTNTDVYVEVFDTSNMLLGQIQVDADGTGDFHLGMVATNNMHIGYFTIRGLRFADNFPRNAGADNISAYVASVPEPGSMLAILVVGGLGLLRRRRA